MEYVRLEQSKACNDCKQIKSFNEFHNNKATSDGKASYCKVCLLARGAAYRQANPEKIKETNRISKKKNLEKSRITKRIHRAKNKDRINAQKREWNKKNKDKVREMNRRSYAKNPELFISNAQKRYAKLKGVEQKMLTKKDYQKLYSQSCIYCGSKESIEVDHIQPIERNGRHAIGNLAAACLSCNRSKSDLFVMEWRIRELKREGHQPTH